MSDGQTKQSAKSGTKIVFIKDVALVDGKLMKLAHCVDTEICPKTSCEVRGGMDARWLPVIEREKNAL